MAKYAKSSKKQARHYPVEKKIRITDPSAVATTLRRIEADRLLSEVNRRMYRQSRVYSMKVDMDIDSTLATSGINVYVLNDTWDLHGAYKLAMEAYYNAMKEEIAAGPGQIGRWMDFKIASGVSSDLVWPVVKTTSLADDRLDAGEHQYSQVQNSGSATSRIFSLSATTTASDWSILSEWRARDAVDDDPTVITANTPYDGLTDELDDANRDLLQSQYNEPPYAQLGNTSPWRKVATLKVEPSGAMKLSTGYFDAPLGIVILDGFPSDSAGTRGVTVCFQGGDYKGVKAAPYATPMLTESKEYKVV